MPTDIATRAAVLALIAIGRPHAEISSILAVPKSTIRDIHSRAIQRGFDHNTRPLKICDAYVVNAPRSGRPKKQRAESQDNIFTERAESESDNASALLD
ncbi:hypothetical protein N7468_010655 [Penicillium chermesinum]|uniref:Uncharacterized protein n=1 Tax=Penicillium chermesinum TaxID=63820 RepID=A0A9W9N844_9EURO|nr:uncharacterized protein N7468_010655 [Penicillium chermesinum]KAJ5214976.1 hypothetical protein N7468_010655 [Penicillium chermesinum]